MRAAKEMALPPGVELTIFSPPAVGRLRTNFFSCFSTLVREFQAELLALGCPLATFQAVDSELAGLPGVYDPTSGGALWLCCIPTHSNGADVAVVAHWPPELTLHLGCLGAHAVLGCVALRRMEGRDGAREVKRLIVTSRARRLGAGRALLGAAVDRAREAGATEALLDSLGRLRAAGALYKAEGWAPCAPYCHNPMEDALFFRLALRTADGAEVLPKEGARAARILV